MLLLVPESSSGLLEEILTELEAKDEIFVQDPRDSKWYIQHLTGRYRICIQYLCTVSCVHWLCTVVVYISCVQ